LLRNFVFVQVRVQCLEIDLSHHVFVLFACINKVAGRKPLSFKILDFPDIGIARHVNDTACSIRSTLLYFSNVNVGLLYLCVEKQGVRNADAVCGRAISAQALPKAKPALTPRLTQPNMSCMTKGLKRRRGCRQPSTSSYKS